MLIKDSRPNWFSMKVSAFLDNKILSALTLLLVFCALDVIIINLTLLYHAAYQSEFISLQLIKKLFLSRSLAILSIILMLSFIVAYRKKLFCTWASIENGLQIRPFILLCVFILAWRFLSYDYNLYFDQSHYFDRSLLLLFALLVYWRPLFLPLFLLLLAAIIWQFAIPLGGYSWAQQNMPIRLLTLFVGAWLLRTISNREWTYEWLFLSCCLVATHYWSPGLQKLKLAWINHASVHNLLPNTYSNGWLSFLSVDQMEQATSLLTTLNPLIVATTLFIQLGVVLCLWKRWLFISFLSLFLCFHLGILLVSGIFFWQWIMLEIGLSWLLTRTWFIKNYVFFNTPLFLLSIVLILTASFWAKPVPLAWYDANAAYTYKFEAITGNQHKHELSPRFFSPYTYQFSLGKFGYLVNRPLLGIVWGSTQNKAVINGLKQVSNLSELSALERKIGTVKYNAKKAARFDQFIQQYISNLNQHKRPRLFPFSLLPSPPQIWTFPSASAYAKLDAIKQINVYLMSSLYQQGKYKILSKELIRKIYINTR